MMTRTPNAQQIAEFQKLRDLGKTIPEISELTGWSKFTIMKYSVLTVKTTYKFTDQEMEKASEMKDNGIKIKEIGKAFNCPWYIINNHITQYHAKKSNIFDYGTHGHPFVY